MHNFTLSDSVKTGPYGSSCYMNMVKEVLNNSEVSDQLIQESLKTVRDNVTIEDSKRMTKTMGLAYVRRVNGLIINNTMKLKLSVKLMNRASDEEKRDIIIHEVSHLVDYVIRHKSNHDHVWKSISISLGGTGNTYHNVDNFGLGRRVKRWEFINLDTGKTVFLRKRTCKKLCACLVTSMLVKLL